MSTETESEPLPEESTSQRIGQDAIRAFDSAHPASWRPKQLSGDDDAGLDFQIQVLRNSRYWTLFHCQLKSSRSPRVVQSDNAIAISLKTTTLNYYANIASPILLAFVDLSVDSDPRRCPVYYLWIHEEVRQLLGGRRFLTNEQETHTFRVPRNNLLSPELDIEPYLADYLSKRRAADGLFSAVADASEETGVVPVVQVTTKVERRIKEGGASLLTSLIEDTETPWIDVTLGANARELKRISEILKTSSDQDAQRALDAIEVKLDPDDTHQRAEFYFLKSRCAELRGDWRSAVSFARTAQRVRRDLGRYLARRVDLFLRTLRDDSIARYARRALRVWPHLKSAPAISVRAKLLVLNRQHGEALRNLDALPADESCGTRALIYFVMGDWSKVVEHVDVCLSNLALGAPQIRVLHMFASAALLRLGMPSIGTDTSTYIVPLTGSPASDVTILRQCWERSVRTLAMMKVAGWPSEVVFLLEPLCLSAVSLNQVSEIYDDIWEMANTRQNYSEVQEYAERLSVLLGRNDQAIQANERQLQSRSVKVRRTILAFSANDYRKAAELAIDLYQDYGTSVGADPLPLALGAISARRLFRQSDEQILREALASKPEFKSEYAVYGYLVRIHDSPLEAKRARMELYQAFLRDPTSEVIQSILFPHLDAHDAEEAQACIDIGEWVKKRRLLAYDDIRHLAQALVTLKNWAALNELVDTAISRFHDDPRVLAMKAIAFEGLGETAAAIETLESIIGKSRQDPMVVDTYINIMMRCGFVSKAIGQLETLLGRESEHARKLEILRTLFVLESARDPTQQKLVDIAWRYGQLAKRLDETEEGVFLQLFFAATLSQRVAVTDQQRSEFQARLETYTQTFPESKLLAAVKFPNPPDAEQVLSMMERISGLTAERKAWVRERVGKLRRGEEVFPFVWRPRNILLNVADPLHLWEIAKSSRKDARELHLQIASPERKDIDFREVREAMPVLDLVALVVLEDLNCFDILLKLFPRIAVTKSTVLILQQYTLPFAGSIYPSIARRIVERLQENLGVVNQPGTYPTDKQLVSIERHMYEEMIPLCSGGSYFLYSDDLVFRYWATKQTNYDPGICTLDVIRWAVERQIASAAWAAEKIGLLCRWNVAGVRVSTPVFLAAIPGSVESAPTADKAEDILATTPPFDAISDALWDYQSDYQGIVNHVAAILLALIPQEQLGEKTPVAIWRRWMTKVRIRSDVNVYGEQHLQNVFLKIVTSPKLLQKSVKRAWSLYKKMIELENGDKMSTEIEKNGIRNIGRLLGKVLDANGSNQLLEKIASAFIPGTSDYDTFMRAFESGLEARFLPTDNRSRGGSL